MPERRRLPAYARPLAQARRQGLRPASNCVHVRVDSWPDEPPPARVHIPVVMVPADADPEALDFSFVRDLEALVHHWPSMTPPGRLNALLREIVAAGPAVLIALDHEAEGEPIATFIQTRAHGLEVAL